MIPPLALVVHVFASGLPQRLLHSACPSGALGGMVATLVAAWRAMRRRLASPDRRAVLHLSCSTEGSASTPAPPAAQAGPVGPSRLVERLAEQLLALRFVMICGKDCIGRTGLALQVAQHLVERQGARTCFANFGAVHDGAAALAALGASVGARRAGGDWLDTIADALGDGQVVVVIDDYDQFADALAPLTEPLLQAVPGLLLLLTANDVPESGAVSLPDLHN